MLPFTLPLLRLVQRPATLTPGVHEGTIPVRVVHYPIPERDRWMSLWKAWEASGREDWSAWQEFQKVASSPRFSFSSWKLYGHFGEALVARELMEQGLECWQGGVAALFHRKNLRGAAIGETADIEARLAVTGFPRPWSFQERLNFRPRNPDITAFHRNLGWRFCEVKLNGDRPSREQLQTLGFLHHLLAARVEIVRVVPQGALVKQREFIYSFVVS